MIKSELNYGLTPLRQVAARENIVRQYDLGTSSQLHGIRVLETEKYICEGNVIEVGGDPNNYEALQASFMNNRRPAGKLLRGKWDSNNNYAAELEDSVQEALMLNL